MAHREEVMYCLEESQALLADGFEDAFLGFVELFGHPPVALYDREKCIAVLMKRDEMSAAAAMEYFDFNVAGAYVGEKTPGFATVITT